MTTEFTANPTALGGNRSSIIVIIEDYSGQGPGMGSTHPPGPALVTAAADADPVTLLVLGWLAAKRSENTRTAYARDIGITLQRRASRAPAWLAWCQEQGVHPVTGVTGLHVARYARQLDAAGLSPASAARKLAAVSGWYAWLAQRGHIAASPAAGIARPRADAGSSPTPALTRDQALALVHAADTAPGPQRMPAPQRWWLSCCSPAPGCPSSSAPTSGTSAPNRDTGCCGSPAPMAGARASRSPARRLPG